MADMYSFVPDRSVPDKRPYRPSNGTEGEIFDAVYCENCARDRRYRETLDGRDGCNILVHALAYDLNHPEYPKEWVYLAGVPTCTAFAAEESDIPLPRCPDTIDMFDVRK